MSRFGLILLGLGIAGWFFASGELEKLGEYPSDVGMVQAVQQYPAARMDVLRYASASMAVLGALIAIMPGRRGL